MKFHKVIFLELIVNIIKENNYDIIKFMKKVSNIERRFTYELDRSNGENNDRSC